MSRYTALSILAGVVVGLGLIAQPAAANDTVEIAQSGGQWTTERWYSIGWKKAEEGVHYKVVGGGGIRDLKISPTGRHCIAVSEFSGKPVGHKVCGDGVTTIGSWLQIAGYYVWWVHN